MSAIDKHIKRHFKSIVTTLFTISLSFIYGQKDVIEVHLKDFYRIQNNYVYFTNPLKKNYQKNSPSIPFYTYTWEIPHQGMYEVLVTFLDSSSYANISIPKSNGLEKKQNNKTVSDSSYFIDAFDSTVFFPSINSKIFQPVIGRDTRFLTTHIFPFKYNASTKTLKVYTRFSIKLIPTNTFGINELLHQRNYQSTQNYYSKSKIFQSKYQAIGEKGELLIVYRNTSDSLVLTFSHWKEQIGFKTHRLKLTSITTTPEDIKSQITHFYDSIPDILYLQLIGDFSEIPSYLYKQDLTDDYYSDTYYTFIDGNDFVPELFVGRFSGTEQENRITILKTMLYEKYSFHDNYEKNIMLIASNEGSNIGDDNETDWEHLRNIGIYLSDSVQLAPSEYFDGSQGGLDADGNPNFNDIKNGINAGKGFIFYTGHGDFSVMNTGSFFTMHVKQLENYNQLPIVISVACNHGKYINLDCMAEVFQHDTKNNQFTGSVGFTGSTILMAWAPPMETQDEFARLINPSNSSYKSTLGAAFYNAQLSMLENYPTTFGEEVMQTWLLFGDPSLKIRINQQGVIAVEHPEFVRKEENSLTFSMNENDCFVSLSQDNQIIASGTSANNQITFENISHLSDSPVEIVATKSNYRSYLGKYNLILDNSKAFNLFPNPTSETLSIYGKYAIQHASIYDLNGKKILSFTDLSTNSINLEQLSAGIYFVQISANNTTYTYKIIKTNEY